MHYCIGCVHRRAVQMTRLTHSGGEVCIAAVEVHDYLDASVLDRSRQPVNRGDATGPQVEQTLGS